MSIKDPFPNPARPPTHATGQPDASGQYRDLCSTCDHAETHARHGRPTRPIFFCEEFEIFGVVRAPESERDVPEQPREARIANGRMGLCVNCDSVDTCTLPKPEGGVWHCEEYC